MFCKEMSFSGTVCMMGMMMLYLAVCCSCDDDVIVKQEDYTREMETQHTRRKSLHPDSDEQWNRMVKLAPTLIIPIGIVLAIGIYYFCCSSKNSTSTPGCCSRPTLLHPDTNFLEVKCKTDTDAIYVASPASRFEYGPPWWHPKQYCWWKPPQDDDQKQILV